MAKTKSQGRVAERIQIILSELLQTEVKDPRLDDVTVLDVEIDREFMVATIYVSALGGEDERDEVMQGLASASGFLRREVAARMRLRRAPELRFVWDETAARAARIESILDSLNIPPAPEEAQEADDAPDRAE